MNKSPRPILILAVLAMLALSSGCRDDDAAEYGHDKDKDWRKNPVLYY